MVLSDLAVDCRGDLADIPGVSYYVSVCGLVPGDDAAGCGSGDAHARRDWGLSRGISDRRADIFCGPR